MFKPFIIIALALTFQFNASIAGAKLLDGDTIAIDGPNLTKNDRTGTAQIRKKHIKLAQESVPAKGTCARCTYNFPKCVYSAIIYVDARIKDEQLRKKKAMQQCIYLENKCIKQCK